jgi:hypothetical protein
MNKDFRLALLRNWREQTPEKVIDFTRYDVPAKEPDTLTRKWSLLGEINQKGTRPQDTPVLLSQLNADDRALIRRQLPALHGLEKAKLSS